MYFETCEQSQFSEEILRKVTSIRFFYLIEIMYFLLKFAVQFDWRIIGHLTSLGGLVHRSCLSFFILLPLERKCVCQI